MFNSISKLKKFPQKMVINAIKSNSLKFFESLGKDVTKAEFAGTLATSTSMNPIVIPRQNIKSNSVKRIEKGAFPLLAREDHLNQIFSPQRNLTYSSKMPNQKNDILEEVERLDFPAEAKKEFKNFAQEHIKSSKLDPYDCRDHYVDIMSQKLKGILPKDFLQKLDKMGKIGEPGILLINNFPIDDFIPSSGSIEDRVKKKGRISEAAMLGLSRLMNREPRSSEREYGGKIPHNMSPRKGEEKNNRVKVRNHSCFILRMHVISLPATF